MEIADLKNLSLLDGPPGFEAEVATYMRSSLEKYCDTVTVDSLGNVTGIISGNSSCKLMLTAHMDEIGFIVHDILPGGFLKFECLGSIDPRLLPGMEVTVLGQRKLRGLVGVNPPHVQTPEERKTVYNLEELSIDTGLDKSELVEAGVRQGTPVTPRGGFSQAGDKLIGKSFDDRAGCALLIEAARRFSQKKPEVTIYFTANCQEETGALGARLTSRTIQPHAAIALEGTVAADLPGVPNHKIPTSIGDGPAITVIDGGMIAHQGLASFLVETAKKTGISCQYRRPRRIGGTEGKAIQEECGCAVTVISVPCRYIHSPTSIMSRRDLAAAADLLEAAINSMSQETLEQAGVYID